MPECLNEIEFNETYTSTKSGKPFWCSPMELKNLFICYASEIGINILEWVRMFMTLPFLKMDDIDRDWVELLQLIPEISNEEEKNVLISSLSI